MPVLLSSFFLFRPRYLSTTLWLFNYRYPTHFGDDERKLGLNMVINVAGNEGGK